ncbi:hypothetical protein BDV95DRAFT_205941 [Massariosphaeria phaeospora]|uniref:Uncharacterized protein n=1 Tax=Massariosphaeria phaeospora TaxID=100035 RepID=A0A7C8M5G0_9PLEO|nr:hypothetical protein BDV95DRAFT_205941 [Massariosphaeria phaeospora]
MDVPSPQPAGMGLLPSRLEVTLWRVILICTFLSVAAARLCHRYLHSLTCTIHGHVFSPTSSYQAAAFPLHCASRSHALPCYFQCTFLSGIAAQLVCSTHRIRYSLARLLHNSISELRESIGFLFFLFFFVEDIVILARSFVPTPPTVYLSQLVGPLQFWYVSGTLRRGYRANADLSGVEQEIARGIRSSRHSFVMADRDDVAAAEQLRDEAATALESTMDADCEHTEDSEIGRPVQDMSLEAVVTKDQHGTSATTDDDGEHAEDNERGNDGDIESLVRDMSLEDVESLVRNMDREAVVTEDQRGTSATTDDDREHAEDDEHGNAEHVKALIQDMDRLLLDIEHLLKNMGHLVQDRTRLRQDLSHLLQSMTGLLETMSWLLRDMSPEPVVTEDQHGTSAAERVELQAAAAPANAPDNDLIYKQHIGRIIRAMSPERPQQQPAVAPKQQPTAAPKQQPAAAPATTTDTKCKHTPDDHKDKNNDTLGCLRRLIWHYNEMIAAMESSSNGRRPEKLALGLSSVIYIRNLHQRCLATLLAVIEQLGGKKPDVIERMRLADLNIHVFALLERRRKMKGKTPAFRTMDIMAKRTLGDCQAFLDRARQIVELTGKRG